MRNFIKQAIGFIIMMSLVSLFVILAKPSDAHSYIVGLLIGFGMPLFTNIWNDNIK